jgi:hypothetical protein
MNFIPYAIRRPFYYVWSLIVSADFRYEEFGRIFDAYEYEQNTQIVGFINYLGMTNQLDLSRNFNLFANAETLEDAVAIWEDYKVQMNISPAQ